MSWSGKNFDEYSEAEPRYIIDEALTRLERLDLEKGAHLRALGRWMEEIAAAVRAVNDGDS